jgi:hypothetical protein
MIDKILQHLSKVKKTSKGYQALCPAHKDTSPSLSVKETADGRLLLHCHAGCTTGAVLASIGLKLSDLYPATNTPRRPPPAPGLSRSELKNAVGFEKTILYFASCDISRGKTLNATDIARCDLARTRLKTAKGLL